MNSVIVDSETDEWDTAADGSECTRADEKVDEGIAGIDTETATRCLKEMGDTTIPDIDGPTVSLSSGS
ncbi:hypothetical protein [Natrinema soli]|uniref:Uncharacterized protein n=1 Tax=Natrinema soli TaxID=1930624 RepID=A0ABD5SXB1_9EURY|nr:hypothetical protein [Natrinema soli]